MDGKIIRRYANPGSGASTLNVSTMFDLEPALPHIVRAEIVENAITLVFAGQDVQIVPGRLASSIGTGVALGILPWDFVLGAAIAVVLGLVLAYTRFGRHTYAIGSNPEAARVR